MSKLSKIALSTFLSLIVSSIAGLLYLSIVALCIKIGTFNAIFWFGFIVLFTFFSLFFYEKFNKTPNQ